MAPSEFVIVMGVSGSGKTTIATGIATATGWVFAEGDDFHPQANVDKMASGHPLNDDDRWPWLRAIVAWMDDQEQQGNSAVLTCSALRRVYRDLLRDGRDNVRFCQVSADEQAIAERLELRRGYYMPASLLPSQIATLEPLEPDEPGVIISAAATAQEVICHALTALDLGTKGA